MTQLFSHISEDNAIKLHVISFLFILISGCRQRCTCDESRFILRNMPFGFLSARSRALRCSSVLISSRFRVEFRCCFWVRQLGRWWKVRRFSFVTESRRISRNGSIQLSFDRRDHLQANSAEKTAGSALTTWWFISLNCSKSKSSYLWIAETQNCIDWAKSVCQCGISCNLFAKRQWKRGR